MKEENNIQPQEAGIAGWMVLPAYVEDDKKVRHLFEQVFGHHMSDREWVWKYKHTRLRGLLLCTREGEAAAFFGGMARDFIYQGEGYRCVQNGDVMVHSSQRGVFSRRGALYQVGSNFFSKYVGEGAEYAFAFGFPNRRHFDLGVKLGLYERAGGMMELRWSPQSCSLRLGWSWDYIQGREFDCLDGLWRDMQKSWPGFFLPVRDSKRWMYRYQQRPASNYVLIIVRNRWTHKPIAAVVLRSHEAHIEWLDYVGGFKSIRYAIKAVRDFAAKDKKPVMALISDAVADCFAIDHESIKLSQISIPVNASNEDPESKPWINRLWLMGGDSDFM